MEGRDGKRDAYLWATVNILVRCKELCALTAISGAVSGMLHAVPSLQSIKPSSSQMYFEMSSGEILGLPGIEKGVVFITSVCEYLFFALS